VSLTFCWLGTAGLELKSAGHGLAIDPFFTRSSLLEMLRPVVSNANLVAGRLPGCDFVLVTHSHYDHILDVPEVVCHNGAIAYGSANTCQLLRICGVPSSQVHEIREGDKLTLGEFEVEVIRGQHSPIPFGRIFNGRLSPGLQPPLHAWDYRMDLCLGYRISVQGIRVLVCAAEPQPADLLFAVAQESKPYYLRLFRGVQPDTFIPIHWDNFTRPLDKPLRRFGRPGRISLQELVNLAEQSLPHVKVIIPELFKQYSVEERGFS
jgi:L-ascorbate metabolism protein UlaG (beta-lactamase superfamily)